MDDLDFIDDDPWDEGMDYELEDEAFWDLLEDPDEDGLIVDHIVSEHKEDTGE